MTSWTTPRTWTDGEFITATMLNIHIRDNLLNIGEHRYTPKSSDTSRASTTAVTADPALTMAVGANETWLWRSRVYVITGAGGFKYQWDVPGGAAGDYAAFDVNNTATMFQDADLTYGTGRGATASITAAGLFVGLLITSGTSGSLTFTWSQNSSNVANSTVKAGSYILARRVA